MGPKILTDVATARPTLPHLEIPLQQVGMENIATQIQLASSSSSSSSVQFATARVNAAVSLENTSARGIHMSRLFKIVNDLGKQPLNREYLSLVLKEMLATHKDLSQQAFLEIKTECLLKRKALLSKTEGWRTYPVTIKAENVGGKERYQVQVVVEYSSTCPCSASLSREAIQQKFATDFLNQAVTSDDIHNWLGLESSHVAVPHSQRSAATVLFEFSHQGQETSIENLIDTLELALGTPVQAAVKREDEQEFARLNGSNLMFCEDAARKIKAALLARPEFINFQIEVRHFESLHAHDVVARAAKN